MDTPPILDPTEHVFDLVPLAIVSILNAILRDKRPWQPIPA
jgi:hypothetical protein